MGLVAILAICLLEQLLGSTLLVPTLFSMKNMLDIVSKFGKDFDMKFSPGKKSVYSVL